MVSFTHEQAGTSEAQWQQWVALQHVRPLVGELPPKLVVLAAHPDDETLGAGALIAQTATAGAQVHVLVATRGEASHPHSPTHSARRLAALRTREVRAAVRALAPCARVHQLALPDGQLAGHLPELIEHLGELVSPGAWLVAPWRGDGHPDHEAAGEAAAEVASHTGVQLLEYPLWAWHWAVPGDLRLPWSAMRAVPVSADGRARKKAAMAEHVTQVRALSSAAGDAALLGPSLLAHFARNVEMFVVSAGR